MNRRSLFGALVGVLLSPFAVLGKGKNNSEKLHGHQVEGVRIGRLTGSWGGIEVTRLPELLRRMKVRMLEECKRDDPYGYRLIERRERCVGSIFGLHATDTEKCEVGLIDEVLLELRAERLRILEDLELGQEVRDIRGGFRAKLRELWGCELS